MADSQNSRLPKSLAWRIPNVKTRAQLNRFTSPIPDAHSESVATHTRGMDAILPKKKTQETNDPNKDARSNQKNINNIKKQKRKTIQKTVKT